MQRCDLYLGNEAPPAQRPGWTIHRGGRGVLTAWRDDLWQTPPTSTWRQAHKGRAGVTPARGSLVTTGTLRNGTKLAIVNGHRINGTGWPGNKRRAFHLWRRDRWMEHHRLDQAIVAALIADGYSVIHGADLNRTDPPKIHPTAITLRGTGITQIAWIPAPGTPFTPAGPGGSIARLASGTTHRLQWADLTLGDTA